MNDYVMSFDEMQRTVFDCRMKLRQITDPEICSMVMKLAGTDVNSLVGANDTIRYYVVADRNKKLHYVDYQ